MINHTAARDGLAQLLTQGLPGVTVQRGGIDAVATFPGVIVGQPAWTKVDNLPYRLDRSTWPIAVVVARNSQDSVVIDELEQLWPAALDLLRTTSEQDQTLGGICDEAIVTRADFGQFAIQGTNYPAQLIFIELYG